MGKWEEGMLNRCDFSRKERVFQAKAGAADTSKKIQKFS
jgi:hypothetical protein